MRAGLSRVIVALLACVAVSSCSSSDGGPGPGDTNPPGVSHVSISDGQIDVGLIERISVTFSDDMDESTIGDSTITVAGRAPRGFVEYDEATRTATFTPETPYAAETWHDFVVSGEVADEAGNAMAPDTTSFQTGTLDTDHMDDYFEPNEDSAEATPIELGERYRTLSITDNDDDVFEFTLSDTAMVLIHSWIKRIDGVSWVRGFDRADGKPYCAAGTDPAPGDSFSWYCYSFLPGTYYFHTYARSYQSGYLVYDFMLTTEEPCRDDAYEDNDFMDDAVPTAEGTLADLHGCRYDKDWFRIDLNAGEELSVTLTATGGVVGMMKRISIHNQMGNELAVTTSVETSITASHTASETAPHYFATSFWVDGLEYNLGVEVD